MSQTIPGTTVAFDMVRLPALTEGAAPLYMATTETTWDALDVIVYRLDIPAEQRELAEEPVDAAARPTRPYIAVDRGFGHAGFPALSVSFRTAQTYCDWLSELTGRHYRLPTAAEWEAACRAGGDDVNTDKATLTAAGWYRSNARYKSHAVGGKAANAWGLHDLAGNVAEWAIDEQGAPVLMGGSYTDGLSGCSCGRRRPDDKAWNASDPNLPKSVWWLADGGSIGFRVVCEVPDEQAASTTPPAGAEGETDDAEDATDEDDG